MPGYRKLLLISLFTIATMIATAVQAKSWQAATPQISFSSATFQTNERAGAAHFDVVRIGDTTSVATIDYVTDDRGASVDCAVFNGVASSHCDFNLAVGTLTFAPGETLKTVDVIINRDSYVEAPFESFTVSLTNPGGGAALGPVSTASVHLIDINDGSPQAGVNVLDRTTGFVRQQYHDFLNREPDLGGLNFWVDNIDQCDDPARKPANLTVEECKDTMRVNTSAAFFLSVEFSQSGGLVHAFYAAALDRPRHLPRRLEFERDHQAVARDVVVGQVGWESLLEANRNAFMKDFVTRPEFVELYPTADAPALYANKLYMHALGRNASATEIDEAITEFENAPTAVDAEARGRVLLRLTQSPEFTEEFNRAFVQMQYEGYLQRNPDELPDVDFSGFDFWLEKLNSFHGNFVDAEMVKAFLLSGEYRSRFGPA